jgi:hypothetical protein
VGLPLVPVRGGMAAAFVQCCDVCRQNRFKQVVTGWASYRPPLKAAAIKRRKGQKMKVVLSKSVISTVDYDSELQARQDYEKMKQAGKSFTVLKEAWTANDSFAKFGQSKKAYTVEIMEPMEKARKEPPEMKVKAKK